MRGNDRIKRWWQEIDRLLQETPGVLAVYALFVFATAVLGGALVWRQVFGSGWWIGVLIVGIAFLALSDFRRWLISRGISREVARLRHLITHIYIGHPQRWKYVEVKIIHRINKNGDDECSRRLTVDAIGDQLHWKEVRVGVSNDAAAQPDYTCLNFRATTESGARLPCHVIQDNERLRKFLIFPEPAIAPGQPRIIKVTHRWPGAWTPLLNNLTDTGGFDASIPEETALITLEFEAPLGVQFTNFNVAPAIGRTTITERGGRSIAVWEANNLKRGEYRWILTAERRPAS